MQATKVQVVVYRLIPGKLDPDILILEKVVNGHSSWNIVTGTIEDGETPLETAIREVLEETGLTTFKPCVQLQNEITFISRYTGKPERELAFAIESCDLTEEVDLSSNPDHEHIGFRWVDPEEAHLLMPWDSFKESIRCVQQIVQE